MRLIAITLNNYCIKNYLLMRVRLYWIESESGIASRWIHIESNLMFTLRSDKDRRKTSSSLCLGVNEPKGAHHLAVGSFTLTLDGDQSYQEIGRNHSILLHISIGITFGLCKCIVKVVSHQRITIAISLITGF